MRGSIRQRTKGTWTISVYIGRDPETRRLRQRFATVKGTKKEAEAELAQMIHAIESGMDFDAARSTVAEYCDQWLGVVGENVKPRTLRRYEELLRLHVKPVVGNVKLVKLKPLHLEKVYAAARTKGLSEQTLLHIHRVVFTALRQAVKWQLVGRNVAEAVIVPSPKPKRVEPLDPADALRLLGSLRATDLEIPAVIGLGTGLRLGEVLGLRWSDVDLDAGLATVNQTLQIDRTWGSPKTHRSARRVTLPPFVVETLRAHRKAQNERRLLCGAGWHNLDLVIDRGNGERCDPRSVSRRFTAAAKTAGLNLTFHGLRHGFATLMLESGVDLKVTQGLLGHSSYGITADLYTHVAEKHDRSATDLLDALLFPR